MQKDCNREDTVYAGFFVRMGAYLVDLLIVAIGLCIVKIPVFCLKMSIGDSVIFKNILFSFDIFDIIYYILSVLYFTLTTYNGGRTVGKRLFCLKVVGENGEKPSFLSILIRETVGRYLSQLVIFVGYIIAGLDDKKQGLHDKIADTFVIYTAPMKKEVPPVRMGNPSWTNPMQQNFMQEGAVQQNLSQENPMQQGLNPSGQPFPTQVSGNLGQNPSVPLEKAPQQMAGRSTPDMVPPIPNPVPFDPAGAVPPQDTDRMQNQ